MTPSYINILNTYALCNTHDVRYRNNNTNNDTFYSEEVFLIHFPSINYLVINKFSYSITVTEKGFSVRKIEEGRDSDQLKCFLRQSVIIGNKYIHMCANWFLFPIFLF